MKHPSTSLRFVSRPDSGPRHLLAGIVTLGLSSLMIGHLPAHAGEELSMVFRDKPPYSYLDNGIAKGFLLERTQQILKAAGINASFQNLPPNRIFQEIKSNQKKICSFGWYKIPERETYARFSLPIHQDKPHAILVGPHAPESIKRHKTLKSLMSSSDLTLAKADGVSYGPELDTLIAGFPGLIDNGLVSPLQVAQKLASRRADFMFMDQEDYDYMLKTNAEFRNDALVPLELNDVPQGLKRYILCSQKVDEDTLSRINAGISKVVLSGPKK